MGKWLFLFTDLIKKFDRQQIDDVLLDLVKDKLDEYQDEFMIIQRIVNF